MKWCIYVKKDDPSRIIIGLAERGYFDDKDKLAIEISKDFSKVHRYKNFKIIDRTEYIVSELDQHIINAFVLKIILKLQRESRWFEIASINDEKYYIYANISNFITVVGSKIKLEGICVFKGNQKIHVDRANIDLERVSYIDDVSTEPDKCFNVGDIYTWEDNYALILEKTEVGYRTLILISDSIHVTTILFQNDFLGDLTYSSTIDIKDLNMRQIVTKFINKING